MSENVIMGAGGRATAAGLDNVVAAETALSHVDGEAGRLIIAGHDLETLVATHDFEGAAALLWRVAGLDPAPSREAVAAGLARARVEAFALVPKLLAATEGLSVTEGLRTGFSMLSDEGALPAHIRAVGAAPVFIAALCRREAGAAAIAPDAGLGHAADFLRMLKGEMPSDAEAKALNAYLVTVTDHGMNASTFTARVIASTRAGTISAIVGALCALKGPLHGGAPGPVLDMLDDIGTRENIEPWLKREIAKGERLMGFGHRVYRVRDPRADVFNKAVTLLTNGNERVLFARDVERAALAALKAAKPDRRLDTNMEYYTAVLLEALGIPRSAVTAVFGMSRVVGWTAHVIEQERVGRLIRPQSRYIGDWPDDKAA
ncbi:MAG TPA: citrate synthase/methylcitrate synthase [Parvibaculum sp.]|uniref:citrate synthase/methylcitrate synthase n=1 Tax=Parvibaculum sp. TaxID=2024848 RepID=UPI002C741A11|nr:citrate synthase/methylcitrate synthase [Parvibaculum sp.]HMM12987.1 citrate synthase/methylcitrate synthase [Parvibaculum sp.]